MGDMQIFKCPYIAEKTFCHCKYFVDFAPCAVIVEGRLSNVLNNCQLKHNYSAQTLNKLNNTTQLREDNSMDKPPIPIPWHMDGSIFSLILSAPLLSNEKGFFF